MAKLDTTIDNIELKTNKVLSSIPDPAWTDDQYPSAKTLYNTYEKLLDAMHPINSILVTSTNEDPKETLGGTWELVDKSAKDAWIPITEAAWSATSASMSTSSSLPSGLTLSGHTAQFRLSLLTTVELNNSETKLGVISPEVCGLLAFPYKIMDSVAMNGRATYAWRLSEDGSISISKLLKPDESTSVPVGQSLYLNFTYLVKGEDLLDSFCDKFYWKRVA